MICPGRLKNRDWSDPEKLQAAENVLQALLDTRVLLTDLSDDDPDKKTDPKAAQRGRMFHDGDYLVTRRAFVRLSYDEIEQRLRVETFAPAAAIREGLY